MLDNQSINESMHCSSSRSSVTSECISESPPSDHPEAPTTPQQPAAFWTRKLQHNRSLSCVCWSLWVEQSLSQMDGWGSRWRWWRGRSRCVCGWGIGVLIGRWHSLDRKYLDMKEIWKLQNRLLRCSSTLWSRFWVNSSGAGSIHIPLQYNYWYHTVEILSYRRKHK